MKELFRRLMLQPWLAAEIGFASLFANVLALASPLFVIQVLNRYVAHGVDATLATLASGTLLAIFLELLFRQIRSRLASDISAQADFEVATGGFGLLIKARAGSLERIPPGQRRQLVGAASAVEGAYGSANIAAIYDVPFALLFLGVLFLLSPLLSGIVAAFLVIVFFIGTFGAMSIQGPTRQMIQSGGHTNTLITTAAEHIDTVRAFNAGETLHQGWRQQTAATQKLRRWVEARQSLIQTLIQTAMALMSVVVVATGARLIVNGEIDVGIMIGANILAARALMPMSRFSQLGGVFARAAQSLALIRDFARVPLEPDSGSSKEKFSGAVEFKDISFSYPGASTPLFESLSLRIDPGNVVVITGGNGAGKTSLARLLAGLIEPVRGHVLADGLDLRQVAPEWWRSQIVYLPQEPALLDASIGDNLKTANPSITDAALSRIITAAGLNRYIDESPGGLDTPITNNGRNLSLGIRRRMALARALGTDGRLAILDEPTEGLDKEGIACVYAAMKDMAARGRTIIAISHDPKLIKGAHLVIDLDRKPVPRIIERPQAVAETVDATGGDGQ